MDNKKNTVSFAVYESMQTKDERIIKRLIVALLICIVLLFATNTLWLLTWLNGVQYGAEISVDSGSGDANYIGNNGDITYGEGKSTQEKKNP